jgi:tRNA (cytidine32/uridine32-2'-O)-methyltransferase
MPSDVRIVLVNTSEPGNIGGVARAMKNMCLEHLVLVNPVQFPHAKATARASGADDLLAKAMVCDSLDEAIAGCHLVLGASARFRRLSWPLLDARQCAVKTIEAAGKTSVAIVFGREHSGLTNDELERCHYLVHIPCNEAYSSLNLAAAVQVIAYELHMAALQSNSTTPTHSEKLAQEQPATAAEMQGFYDHLMETLTQIGFLNSAHPRKMMRRLRRLFNKAQMEKVEMNIMRGILSTVQKIINAKDQES